MKQFDINIKLLHLALNFYERLGYRHLSAPMLVDKDVVEYTLPEGCIAKEHVDGKYYVGSAEQSFLQLIKDGESFTTNKFMMITPCQRDEKILDDQHLEIFLKIELISLNPVDDVLEDVRSFLRTITNLDIDIMNTGNGSRDLYINNIEVGSFGFNTYNGIKYQYGTGIALPRLTQSL